MGIKVVKSGNEIIEDGIYAAEVKSLEERHNNGKRSYIFYFIVKSNQHHDVVLSGLVPPLLWEGSALDKWLTAIMGRRIHSGEEIDLETAISGKKCRVKVKTVTRRGSHKYSNVVEVFQEE